jgi:8-oxo-dGTP pyrophosphatase MutT (NUDIX family)
MYKEVELVDLVDVSGNIKIRGVPRFETGLYPNLHLQIVIAVVFDKEGRILVHQRAKTKKINPGDIDHVCGGVISGETPEMAARREADEETGIKPKNLKVITQGINIYNRFRYLLVGESNDTPKQDSVEAEWAGFISLDELREKQRSGVTFVDEFFEDTELAIRGLAQI